MSPVYEFLFLLFPHLMFLVLAGGDGNGYHQGGGPTSFPCGYLGNISFPFTVTERQDCGVLPVHNCDDHPLKHKMIQLLPTPPPKKRTKLRDLLFGKRSRDSAGKLSKKLSAINIVEELFEEGSAMLAERVSVNKIEG